MRHAISAVLMEAAAGMSLLPLEKFFLMFEVLMGR